MHSYKQQYMKKEYKMKPIPVLYERKEDCCGCTACYNADAFEAALIMLGLAGEYLATRLIGKMDAFLLKNETSLQATYQTALENKRVISQRYAEYENILKEVLKQKDSSNQCKYPDLKAELCAFKGGEWIRVAGELVEDDRVEARQSMLDAYPGLKKMYAADDGNTEVFYFKNGVATISAFTHEPKVIKF